MKYRYALLLFAFATVLNGQSAPKVLIPHESWTCGMPDGIPAPETGSLVFELEMKFEKVLDVGKTPFGERKVIVGQEGTLSGPKLTGTVMAGALDFELKLSNGTIEIEQVLVLKTSDGKYVYVRNAGTGTDSNDVRVVMDFEAPNAAPSAWLNTGKYVARRAVNTATKTFTMRVYDVSSVSLPTGSANVTRITKPAGNANQPWDYRKAAATEKQGEVLITETVTLSPSQSVGMSKRGNRNIIPITGGELSGRIPARCFSAARTTRTSRAPGNRCKISLAGEQRRHHHRSQYRLRQAHSDFRGTSGQSLCVSQQRSVHEFASGHETWRRRHHDVRKQPLVGKGSFAQQEKTSRGLRGLRGLGTRQ
jgi:hypothetical protein